MTTWAQIIDNVIHNAVTVEPSACFNAKWLEGKEFIVVDDFDVDGQPLEHGAKKVVGGYKNPPKPAAVYRVLTKIEFNKHCWSKLGMAAFQRILESVRSSAASTDAEFEAKAAVSQYDSALTFSKSEVEALGQKIVDAGFMTSTQYNLVVGSNWPEV